MDREVLHEARRPRARAALTACSLPAGDGVAAAGIDERRRLGAAAVGRERAARGEGAADDRLREQRHEAGDLLQARPRAGRLGVDVEPRDRRASGRACRDAAGCRTAPRPAPPRPCGRHTSPRRARAVSATTPRSWVISTMAVPVFSLRSSIRSRICAWMVTSSAVVGSSAISTCGSQRQRHGDHHALAHAARELVRIFVEPALGIGDAHQVEHLARPLARRAPRHAPDGARRSRRSACRPSAPD